ncbi:MAG: DUF4112 domain-containing protein [Euzebya sp.]
MAVESREPATDVLAIPEPAGTLDAQARQRWEAMKRLSTLLDSQFRIPLTSRTFGIDAIVGLVPWFGGATGLALSAAVIAQGILIGARGATVVRMVLNVLIDAALGAIPVVGNVTDFVFKANDRNVKLLSTHALDPQRTRAQSARLLLLTAVGLGVAVLAMLAVSVVLAVYVSRALFG